MKNQRKNKETQDYKSTDKTIIKKGIFEIGKKLGIAIPTSLLLLFNVNADATPQNLTP